jgi:thiol-disulfide isomerase/thioredoxin
VSASTPATVTPPPVPAQAARPRLVLWASLAAGLVVAMLVVVFALAGSPNQTNHLVGQPAPPLSGTAIGTGRPVSLAQYAGKWVLVDFGASTCVDCREELPELRSFAATASRYDATLVTVDEEPGDGAALYRYMRANHADWPVLAGGQASVEYGVSTIPAIFLVNPVGYVDAYYPAGITPSSIDALLARAIKAEGGA